MGSSLTVPFRPSDISTGLVGYWKFNNDATDSSGSGYNLTANGTPTYTTDTYWKDGEKSSHLIRASSQYYSVTNASAPNLNITGSYSVHAKIKLASTGNSYIVSRWGSNQGYYIYTDGTYVTCANDTSSKYTTYTIPVGKWTDLDIVYDTTTNTVNFFFDGNLFESIAQATDATSNTSDFQIGALNAPSNFFNGEIKDVAVWNVALTPLQIKSLALGVDLSKYAYRPNNVSTQPTHWWKLNEVSGNRADSVSTNPLTLTDNNSVLSSGGYVEGVGADFEGSASEHLTVPDSDDWNFGLGDYTVRWRAKWESIDINENRVWALGEWSSGKGIQMSYVGGTWTLYNNGNAGSSDTFTNTSVAGVWYDYCLKRASGNIYFFVDGIQVGTSANTDDIDGGSGGGAIGVWNGTLTYYYDGVMEDFAVWKGYALTDAEIKSLACALPIQRQGIVSYWKLDETSGNRVDSIGANTLTDNNTVLYGAGKVGNAADFEKDNNEYLSINNATQVGLNITTDVAFGCWFKPETWNVDTGLFGRGFTGGGYNFWISGAGTLGAYVNAATTYTTGITFTAGTWYYAVGIATGASVDIYIDGRLITAGASTNLPASNTSDFRIGQCSNDEAGDFDGLVDEAFVAQRYFRPEEIKAVYLKGLNGSEVTSSEVGVSDAGGNVGNSSFFMMF